jgi:hypothetical protein
MTQTFEIFAKQEIEYLDERYLENLKRLKKLYEINECENKKLDRKILAIQRINSGDSRRQL